MPDSACPEITCGLACCWKACAPCVSMAGLWRVECTEDLLPLEPQWIAAEGVCVFGEGGVAACDRCSCAPRCWYVQPYSCDLPISPGVITWQEGCEWTSCCPPIPLPSSP